MVFIYGKLWHFTFLSVFLHFSLLCSIFTFYCSRNHSCHLWQATRKKSAHANAHCHALIHNHALPRVHCKVRPTWAPLWNRFIRANIFQLIAIVIAQAEGSAHAQTHTHTDTLLYAQISPMPICKWTTSLHTAKPGDNPSWIMESHMTDGGEG